MNMLELQKFVLQQVSDSSALFKKELRKSYLWLNKDEFEKLKEWVNRVYGSKYPNIIDEVFYSHKVKIKVPVSL